MLKLLFMLEMDFIVVCILPNKLLKVILLYVSQGRIKFAYLNSE